MYFVYCTNLGYISLSSHPYFSWLASEAVSRAIQLTVQGVCDVLDVKRHTLRRWLEELPVFSSRPTRARSARRFDMGDILFLGLVSELEQRYGLSLATISRFSDCLYETIRGPQRSERLVFLDLEESTCFSMAAHTPTGAGIILDLEPVYRRVTSAFSMPSPFPELPFGPMVLVQSGRVR